jgi:hypothetical protein
MSGIVTGMTNQPIVRSGTRLAMVVDFNKEDLTKHLTATPNLPHAEYIQNEYLGALIKEIY